MNKRQIGSEYEAEAASYLEQKGYVILEKNYRTKRGEIDLIAKDGETIVFVEVKYRSTRKYGSPFEAVDARKQRRIVATALYYCAGKHYSLNRPYRFDVIGIDGDGTITHIENAFCASI